MSKINVPSLINYINQNNMNTSEFMKQMVENFNNKIRLSKKQVECLNRSVSNHKYCKNFFTYRSEEISSNKFLTSLSEQFQEKNFLTDKQILCLRKYEEELRALNL